ncbi:MAG: efflux RND transporter periplasmic adaptor subunit, partial [Victivallaceae bacterium]|nr:efflux RND transporter periplasmic adaptor subunit [Victivallaceae bacterium]
MRKWLISGAAMCVGASILAQGAAPAPAVTVSVQPAVEMKQSYAKKYAGLITPIEEVSIVPRVTGIIEKINFQEGAMVKADSLLFEIEDVTYRASVDSARAVVAEIEASLRYTQTNFDRQKKLLATSAIAKSVFDDAEKQLATSNAQLAAARAALVNAENTLSYTRIASPITGRIGKCALTHGNLVTPSTGEMVKITQIAPIYVEFSVGERDFRSEFGGMSGFAKNAIIEVELADGSLFNEQAEVAVIDPVIDHGTNTIKIWATFKNTDSQLIPGSYVTVRLGAKLHAPLVGVLPSALQVDRDGTHVYVIRAD